MSSQDQQIADDVRALSAMGYGQELLRRMSGFSNYAISLSIICILAGCLTSFPIGFCGVGGAALGLGWPLGCLFSLFFALSLAQLASAFPTAGGLYHWAAILGGRGWGWVTAWYNLAGLVIVLAAINLGMYEFVMHAFGQYEALRVPREGMAGFAAQIAGMLVITGSQALLNHLGIRITTRITDFSGYWILFIAVALTVSLLIYAPSFEPARLVSFRNYSGAAGGDIWPATDAIWWLFLLGLLLPAYTVTGFDASAHAAEETVGAAHNVPRGIVRSVAVSGVFGWFLLAAILLAMPSPDEAASRGGDSFHWTIRQVLPDRLALVLYFGIGLAQYFCGLATVTSASRMTYAFARDGGLPWSSWLRQVSPRRRTPAAAIWTVAGLSVAFTVYTPVYSTITAACVIFLYISYLLPMLLGLFAYGRTWTRMGPWNIGGWYRVLTVLCVLGCALLIVIGVQPPNDRNLWIVLGSGVVTAVVWLGYERRRFQGPPQALLAAHRHEATPPVAGAP